MLCCSDVNSEDIIQTLLASGIVVLRTDTIYGILARASDEAVVDKIYTAKGRQATKPFIILVSHAAQAYDNAELLETYAETYRDRPTSIIVEAPSAPDYLKRGGTNLAYRIEHDGLLHDIIEKTGPLVAPSANPEGMPPARTIEEARDYFGDNVDLYIDGGEVPENTTPSRIIRINPDGSLEQLR